MNKTFQRQFLFFCFLRFILSFSLVEKSFPDEIEKILLLNNEILVGTKDFLYRLSSKTFEIVRKSSNLSSSSIEFHWKILLVFDDEKSFLGCGTNSFDSCFLFDKNLLLIVNSTLPVVSTENVAGIFPSNDFVIFASTLTVDEKFFWKIPNFAVRSLNRSNWMKIRSNSNNFSSKLFHDEFSLKFSFRHQKTFSVRYVSTFFNEKFLFFVTKQLNDIDDRRFVTKIVRFCRQNSNSNSFLRSYSEMSLRCGDDRFWIVKTIRTFVDKENRTILFGHFHRRDRRKGTKICFWNVENEIEKKFIETYRRCYSMGIGQRGLNFIKTDEKCRKDEIWNDEDFCRSMNNERLVFPVGVSTPLDGHLFYENLQEETMNFDLNSFVFDRSFLFVQTLVDGTLKLGHFDESMSNLQWIFSKKFPSNDEILFDFSSLTFFFSSNRKIFRWSLVEDCATDSFNDQCLSSLNSSFCLWCFTLKHLRSKSIVVKEKPQVFDVQPRQCSITRSCLINVIGRNFDLVEEILLQFSTFLTFKVKRNEISSSTLFQIRIPSFFNENISFHVPLSISFDQSTFYPNFVEIFFINSFLPTPNRTTFRSIFLVVPFIFLFVLIAVFLRKKNGKMFSTTIVTREIPSISSSISF